MFHGELLFQLYNTFTNYLLQQIRYSLRRLNRGNHQEFGIHIGKVDAVSSVADQLRQEGSLGSAVAFPEGVQFVGHTIEIYELIYEFIVW